MPAYCVCLNAEKGKLDDLIWELFPRRNDVQKNVFLTVCSSETIGEFEERASALLSSEETAACFEVTGAAGIHPDILIFMGMAYDGRHPR